MKKLIPYFPSHEDFVKKLKAAEQGDADAQNSIGHFYETGCETAEVKQDPCEAIKWYEKAAEQGDDIAMRRLARIFKDGVLVPENPSESFKWRERVAKLGDYLDNYILADYYKDGYGTKKDIDKTIELLTKTIYENKQAGRTEFCFLIEEELGDCFFEKGDYEKAIEHYESAIRYDWYEEAKEKVENKIENIKTELSKMKAFVSLLNKEDENKSKEYYKKIDNIEKTTSRIDKTTSVTQETVLDTNKKVNEMYDVVLDINKRVLSLKKQFAINDSINTSDKNEQKLEELITEEIKKETKEKLLNTTEYEKAQEELKELLGDNAWGKADSESKMFLTTAILMLKGLSNSSEDEEIDYSGICLSAIKPIEFECKKHFYEKLKKYAEENLSIPNDLPLTFLNRNSKEKRMISEENFTLNAVQRLLNPEWYDRKENTDYGKKAEIFINDYLKILLKNPSDENTNKFRKNVSKLINPIRKYRNAACHTGSINREDAIKCLKLIIQDSNPENRVLRIILDALDI